MRLVVLGTGSWGTALAAHFTRHGLDTVLWGRRPELVAEMGLAFIEGMRRAGIIGVAKHFPGHGATADDKAKTLIKKLIFATLSVIALVWAALGRREAVVVGAAVAGGAVSARASAPSGAPRADRRTVTFGRYMERPPGGTVKRERRS